MKAMILAAGFGTRLRPLTLLRPKALVPVGNRPLVERTIAYLERHGVREVAVNAHHLHRQLAEHFAARRGRSRVHLLVEPEILGTGGGIRNAEAFLEGGPFVVINGDVVTDIDLSAACADHLARGSLATLVLHRHPAYSQVLLGPDDRILDIAGDRHPGRWAFTGIHILSPRILEHLPAASFSSIIDCYRARMRCGDPVRGHAVRDRYWCDIGTLEGYVRANRDTATRPRPLLGPGCRIQQQVRFSSWAVVGAGSSLEEGAEIRRSILWEQVRVRSGVRVVDSVVTAGRVVERDLIGEVL